MSTRKEDKKIKKMMKEHVVEELKAIQQGYVKHTRNAVIPVDSVDVGRKDDEGKLRYDLVDPYALEQLVKVLTFGAKKYGDRNWEKGIKFGRVFGACMRHLWRWWSGKGADKETGLSPLAHAMCCIMFLLRYTQDKVTFDDRPVVEPPWPAKDIRALQAKEVEKIMAKVPEELKK